MRGEMGNNNPLDFQIVTTERSDAQQMPCFVPQKQPWTNQNHMKIQHNPCVIQ